MKNKKNHCSISDYEYLIAPVLTFKHTMNINMHKTGKEKINIT